MHEEIKNMDLSKKTMVFLNKTDREIAKPLDFGGKITYAIKCENTAKYKLYDKEQNNSHKN